MDIQKTAIEEIDPRENLIEFMANIEKQIKQLNEYEAEVMSRPNSASKQDELKRIKQHKDKLVNLAQSQCTSA